MSLLTPWALVWLGAIPALVWLWRLSSTQRRVRVPSLIPFEPLLRRPSRRRTRLVVNLLFWLQLAALLGLALALARPVLWRREAKTILVVLDTSASMGARRGGADALDRAKRLLAGAMSRAARGHRLLVMTTAPVAPLLLQPTGDAEALGRALQAVRVSHLGGNVATTAQVGRALLGASPDEAWVVTDEPRPASPLPRNVRWWTVGEPLPNVALVGLDAQGPLCAPAEPRLIATVQNFSTEPSAVTVAAIQRGRQLAAERVELAPRARRAVPLLLSPDTSGEVELALDAPRDGLEADNRAWLDLPRTAQLPLVAQLHRPAVAQTVSAWLDACPALRWTATAPPDGASYLLITDHDEASSPAAAASLRFLLWAESKEAPAATRPALSRWLVSPEHPIGAYVAPIDVVAAPLNLSPPQAGSGVPVVWAIVNGRKSPIVLAEESERHRRVSLLFDPSGNPESMPMALIFFNSLRWLMGHSQAATVGRPLALDPLESNLIDRASTWRPAEEFHPPPNPAGGGMARPLTRGLLWLLLLILLVEWWLYCARGKTFRVPGSG